MFCLRSWLPLLFIPTNASPLFIISFVALSYILHRPCIYCSALLIILFISSCHWSERCFFDLRGDWFSPRFENTSAGSSTTTSTTSTTAAAVSTGMTNATSVDHDLHAQQYIMNSYSSELANGTTLGEYFIDTINSTAKALGSAAVAEAKNRLFSTERNVSAATCTTAPQPEWTGIGLEWMRKLLGRREWTLPCINVKVRI